MFEEVRLMQALQAAGKGRPRKAVILRMPSSKWKVRTAAAAALLLAGLGLTEMWHLRQPVAAPVAVSRRAAQASSELQLLAQVEAPRYTAANLRSSAGDREEKFRAAMAKYSSGDYAAAAEALRGLVSGGAETAAARFYLSISDLKMDNWQEPVTLLRSIDAMGETPYLEQARFFLAKALLANHDIAGATQALEQTIALKGDREAEARSLLERVHKLP